jgi:hypothetical protein
MGLPLIGGHYYYIIWNSMDDTITLSGTTWMLSWNQENRFSLFDALACQNFVTDAQTRMLYCWFKAHGGNF